MFIDSAKMTVRAGDGGRGCVAFRREKFVPRGGPNGGDGGNGGSVVLVVVSGYNTLLHVHHRRLIKASRGEHGKGSNKTGAAGCDGCHSQRVPDESSTALPRVTGPRSRL